MRSFSCSTIVELFHLPSRVLMAMTASSIVVVISNQCSAIHCMLIRPPLPGSNNTQGLAHHSELGEVWHSSTDSVSLTLPAYERGVTMNGNFKLTVPAVVTDQEASRTRTGEAEDFGKAWARVNRRLGVGRRVVDAGAPAS